MRRRFSDDELITAVVRCGGNISDACNLVGISRQGFRNRQLKSEAIRAAIASSKELARSKDREALDSRVLPKNQWNKAHAGVREGDLAALLVENFGSIPKVAELLQANPVELKKRINGSEVLRQALEDGQEYYGLYLEDRYQRFAAGDEEASSAEGTAMAKYLACKRGWTPKQKVEHSGHVFDVSSLPDDLGEIERPNFQLIKGT